jgi:quercetin dioxygenase-like cupin family protein
MRLTLALGALMFLAAPITAAPPPDTHVDVPARSKGLEVNVVEHDLAPGQSSGWHIHHGIEIAYVLSGAVDLQIKGRPIRHVVAGETFEIERDTPHIGTNDGTVPAAMLITYLKDKAGPWKIPVPRPTVQEARRAGRRRSL